MRRRPVAALARLARARGVGAWIVGGALRDALLGIADLDVDVAVSRDAEGLAGELEASGFGRAVVLAEESPRVVRVAGKRSLDLADLAKETIEEDLARRDFTANALAIDLATRAWLDPFGGAADVARRRLRLVRAENLVEDPLRAFRAARFYATHGLRPDAAALAACRRIAPRLRGVAVERVSGELSKLLAATAAAPAFRWALAARLLPPALGLDAGPVRLRETVAYLSRLDAPLRRLSGEERRLVRLAAIADGAGLSPPETAAWLSRRRFGRSEAGRAARVLELVRRGARGLTGREAWSWIRDAGDEAPAALLLLAAGGPARRRKARRLARLLRRARRGPRVTGKDVLRWLGISPGPRIGELLREVEIESLRGGIRTKLDARRWLWSNRAGKGGRLAEDPKA